VTAITLGRSIAGAFTATAVVAVSALIATPAFAAGPDHVLAADITVGSGPGGAWVDGTDPYLGWHFETGTGVDVEDGLEIGDGANSYVLNGLVNTGEPGLPVTFQEFEDLVLGATIVGTGAIILEVPYATTGGAGTIWGTLQVDMVSGAVPTATSTARTSKPIPDPDNPGTNAVEQNVTLPLGTILDALEDFTAVNDEQQLGYSGYGFWASPQDPAAVVASITFGGETTTFGLAAEEDDDDADDADEDELAETGAQDATPLAVTAGALLLLGGVLLFVRRRTAAQRDAR